MLKNTIKLLGLFVLQKFNEKSKPTYFSSSTFTHMKLKHVDNNLYFINIYKIFKTINILWEYSPFIRL